MSVRNINGVIKRGKSKAAARVRRQVRGRKRISGTTERPRLVVSRSSRHLFVQVVDDTQGRTLVSASTMEADLRSFDGDKTAKAKKIGEPWPSGQSRPASRRSFSTAAATSTTVGSRRSPTVPAKEGSPCDHPTKRSLRSLLRGGPDQPHPHAYEHC